MECGYGGHGDRFSKYECDSSKYEKIIHGTWRGDSYQNWRSTIDPEYWSILQVTESPKKGCNVGDHHPENGGGFIEGIDCTDYDISRE